MPRAKLETAFIGRYTLAALDAAPDAAFLWLGRALFAWILRDELPQEIPPEHLTAWTMIREESVFIHESRKQFVEAGRKGGEANASERKRKEANTSEGKRTATKIESKSKIEKETPASAGVSRAPATVIPESLAEEEAAFAEFWNIYPRRDYKNAARRAWGNLFGTLPPKPETLAAILAAVRRDRASDQWREDGGRYIPNAAKWLENRPWEARNDALPPPSPLPRRSNETNLTAIHSGNPQYDNLPV